MDCDQTNAGCGIQHDELLDVLQKTLDYETELLRTYTMTSERLHEHEELKERLLNFAQGNAKRSRQLLDEIGQLKQ